MAPEELKAPRLAAEDIKVWYQPDTIIASAARLEIPAGKVVGLLGGNGAGKTTLIKGISGILPGWQCGKFSVDAKLTSPAERAFKAQRYTVFADDRSFFTWSFRQFLDDLCGVYRVEPQEEFISSLVEGFHFAPHKDKQMRDLSSGNNKKARLICAFVLGRPLLILDEPVDFLDFVGTEFLYQCINAYSDQGHSVFLSSHIAESFTRCCDLLYVLKEGQLSGPFAVPREAKDVVQLLSEKPRSAVEYPRRYRRIFEP